MIEEQQQNDIINIFKLYINNKKEKDILKEE